PRGTFEPDVVTSVEVAIKYAGYIEREKLQAEKNNRLEYIRIPADFDFDNLQSLSIECRQKLKRYKPETIAQASRISGVSPADISVLLVYFGR
ncbi:MAG: tRNA uridine-5-carboxymethylaminomethyl(34) synthesis enzyme MnmG, partial [Bacteroidales bacterium]|nr:tRNA uridine-5-carboxymethylaminomethyl(34) synthesis enzyme MnmG [Bacteroidales bacterium]